MVITNEQGDGGAERPDEDIFWGADVASGLLAMEAEEVTRTAAAIIEGQIGGGQGVPYGSIK